MPCALVRTRPPSSLWKRAAWCQTPSPLRHADAAPHRRAGPGWSRLTRIPPEVRPEPMHTEPRLGSPSDWKVPPSAHSRATPQSRRLGCWLPSWLSISARHRDWAVCVSPVLETRRAEKSGVASPARLDEQIKRCGFNSCAVGRELDNFDKVAWQLHSSFSASRAPACARDGTGYS